LAALSTPTIHLCNQRGPHEVLWSYAIPADAVDLSPITLPPFGCTGTYVVCLDKGDGQHKVVSTEIVLTEHDSLQLDIADVVRAIQVELRWSRVSAALDMIDQTIEDMRAELSE